MGRSPIQELQQEVVDEKSSIASLLRKAKLIAAKLSLPEVEKWIDDELNGYRDIAPKNLPEYRIIMGSLVGKNPYSGWVPIMMGSEEDQNLLCRIPVMQSVHSLSELISSKGDITFGLSVDIERTIHKMIDLEIPITRKVPRSALSNIVDAVRNRLLDWTIELEKSGVAGSGFDFSDDERKRAIEPSHQIFTNNYTVINSIDRGSSVSINQSSHDLDVDQVSEIIDQIRLNLQSLPSEIREKMEGDVGIVEDQLNSSSPNQGVIRSAIDRISDICNGAGGNLLAQGILKLIESL